MDGAAGSLPDWWQRNGPRRETQGLPRIGCPPRHTVELGHTDHHQGVRMEHHQPEPLPAREVPQLHLQL